MSIQHLSPGYRPLGETEEKAQAFLQLQLQLSECPPRNLITLVSPQPLPEG